MKATHRVHVAVCAAAACVALIAGSATAQDAQQLVSPRWMVEIKGGDFEPDLDSYQLFYGDDEARHLSAAFAYRFRPWLEIGAEIGGIREEGVGLLAAEAVPGGEVTYTLMPLHVVLNLRGVFRQNQLIVPYLGVGFSAAYYKQDIELQSDRTGTSALGGTVRAGLQLSLNRWDPDARSGYGEGEVKRSFFFVEAQRFTTEQGDTELGGDLVLLGFRFEFGKDARLSSARDKAKGQ